MNKGWRQDLKKKKSDIQSHCKESQVQYLTDSLQGLQENTGQMCMNRVCNLSKEALHNPD